MRIINLSFVHTGTHEDPQLRPYETLVQDNSVFHLMQEETEGGTIITPNTMNNVAARMLRQSAESAGVCTIPNGFGEQRLRFMLEVELNSQGMTRNRQIIVGYTDYPGVTRGPNGQVYLDPKMRMIPNTNITLRDAQYIGDTGQREYRTTIVDNSQILHGGHIADTRSNRYWNKEETYSIRPQDVIGVQAATQRIAEHGGDVIDTRTQLNSGIRKSSRDNLVPSRYLSKAVSSLVLSHQNESLSDSPLQQVLQNAYGLTKENTMAMDQVFSTFNNKTRFLQDGDISWQEFCGIFPDADDKAMVYFADSPKEKAELSQRGDSEHWRGSGINTQFANRIMNAIPGLMSDNMMVSAFFSVTNETHDGRFQIEWKDHCRSFTTGLDMTGYLQRFEVDLISQVLVALTSNSEISINFTGMINIMGDSRLWISVGGEQVTEFTTANYADAVQSPVLTTNNDVVAGIGHDLNSLASFADFTNNY